MIRKKSRTHNLFQPSAKTLKLCLPSVHLVWYIVLWYILLWGEGVAVVHRLSMVLRGAMGLKSTRPTIYTIAILGLGWVDRGAFIGHLSLETSNLVSSVGYSLNTTIRKVDLNIDMKI